MKLRNDIVRIVNELSEKHDYRNYDFDLIGCYELVFGYCKEHGVAPSSLNVESDNGVLVINGEYIERVAAFNWISSAPQKKLTGLDLRFF